jgi:hypothetical protein
MAETQTSAGKLLARLEDIMEQLPKEGYKAAVVVGLVGRVIELVDKSRQLARKAKCLGENKGSCLRTGLCLTDCGGVYVRELEDQTIIGKFSRNTFTTIIGNDRVEFKVKDARLIVEPRTVTYAIIGKEGLIWEEDRLTDLEDLYAKNYSLKYVLRKVGRPLEKALEAVSTCAAASAIVC